MITLLNIGNSNTVSASYADGRIFDIKTVKTDKFNPNCFRNRELAVSSVVPDISSILQDWRNVFIVDNRLETGLNFSRVEKQEIGADRICNAAALAKYYLLPAISIDFGTAVTIEAVDEEKRFLGGAILPGRAMQIASLFSGTGKIKNDFSFSSDEWNLESVGKNTKEAVCLGVKSGIPAAVKEIIKKITANYFSGDTSVVVTGGDAEFFKDKLDLNIHRDSDLTLKGLAYIYELNKNNRS